MDTAQASTATVTAIPVGNAQPAPVATDPPAPAPAAAADPAKDTAAAAGSPAEPEKKPIDVAKGFAALSREDQRIRDERARLKAEREELVAARDALVKAKGSPRDAMRLLGYTEEQILQAIANGETADTQPSEADRVTSLERWKADRERQEQEAAAAARRQSEQQVEAQFFNGVTKQIKDAGEKYELVNADDEHDEVHALIRGHFSQTGKLMPWERAAQLVEDALQEKEKARIERRAKKQQQPATAATATTVVTAAKSDAKKPPSETSAAATTLNNSRLTGGPSRIESDGDLPLDPDERTAEIMRRRAAARA